PIMYLKMDELSGQTLYDVGGSGNNGILGADASAGSDDPMFKTADYCVKGACLKFTGAGDYVTTTYTTAIGTGSFTMEAWIKMPNANQLSTPIKKWGTDGGNYTQFGISICGDAWCSTAGQKIVMWDYKNGGKHTLGTTDVCDNKWHHVAIVRSSVGPYTRLYIDGSNEINDTNALVNLSNTDPLALSLGGTLNGYMDDVRVYNYARTPAQVSWDYNNGKPLAWWKMDDGQNSSTTCDGTTSIAKDTSGSRHGTLKLSGSPATSTAWIEGKYGCALDFDGVDDYVSVSSTPTLEPFNVTEALWFKVTGDGTHSDGDFLLSKGRVAVDPYQAYGIEYIPSSDKIICLMGVSGHSYWDAVSASTFAPGSAWAHAACTFDGSTIRLYINGKLEGSSSHSGTLSYTQSDANLNIGNWGVAGFLRQFQGYLDDVRVYGYALTPAQIKMLYNEGASVRLGPSSGLP
ncbi:MAG: LamG domain-containing protein, partial [Candidatus Pacebacteria bacterium]|nr:LamG domain-containing protein [Candidatus Paceibacterota bacterium]